MIRAEALTRLFGQVQAVKEVSFEIGSGEIVGLLGHNGAGKTTIMKMMTGCLEPSSGSITINGVDVWLQRSSIQRQIGYLPENCPLYPDMTVIDYLDYAAALRGVPEQKKIEQIGSAIEKTNLISVVEKSINTISRGYKQRLGVAQAILNSPEILILDEPTNGLDPSQILEMRSLITELAKTATVVVSTHILQEVQAVCSRVIIINDGQLALDANMSELQTTGRLHVSTDSNPETFSQILAQLPNLSIINCQTHEHRYVYIVDATAQNPFETAANVARILVENHHKVFSIQPIVRDLESIFGEITTKGGVSTDKDKYSLKTSIEEKANANIATPGIVSDTTKETVSSASQEDTQ
jgi:ABC-2 type transport system ATP-binding protein